MYERILVPVDASPRIGGFVDTAIELARTHDAAILVLHVIQREPIVGMPMEPAWPGLADVVRADGDAAVDAVASRAEAAGIPVETEVVAGNPSQKIVRTAEERDCDVIVMGTHGRAGINRLLLGSVSEAVVRRSNVPVLTIRDPGESVTETTAADADVHG